LSKFATLERVVQVEGQKQRKWGLLEYWNVCKEFWGETCIHLCAAEKKDGWKKKAREDLLCQRGERNRLKNLTPTWEGSARKIPGTGARLAGPPKRTPIQDQGGKGC